MKENFIQDFEAFLKGNGVAFKRLSNAGIFIEPSALLIVPVSLETAYVMNEDLRKDLVMACEKELQPCVINDIFFLYEDVFRRGEEQWRRRILARCGLFESVFARKCRVVSLRSQKEKELARAFLEENHSLGWCGCRTCYALVLDREDMQGGGAIGVKKYEYGDGVIVALASFSSALAVRRYHGKDLFVDVPETEEFTSVDSIPFESYQWLRYASVAGVRVIGGMGRLLKAFMKDIQASMPDDYGAGPRGIEIMSYSDNEWSCGNVYRELGFSECGGRGEVEFLVDRSSWRRLRKLPLLQTVSSADTVSVMPLIRNCGSKRYLLQLI